MTSPDPLLTEIPGAHRGGGVLRPGLMPQIFVSVLAVFVAYGCIFPHLSWPMLALLAAFPAGAMAALLIWPRAFEVWDPQVSPNPVAQAFGLEVRPAASSARRRAIVLLAPLALTAPLLFEVLKFNILDVWPLAVVSGAGAAVILGVTAVRREAFRQWPWALGGLVLASALIFGACAEVDVLTDRRPAQQTPGRLLGVKGYADRGGRVFAHDVIASSEATGRVVSEVKDGPLYRLRRGAPVCIAVHRGALGIRWASASVC